MARAGAVMPMDSIQAGLDADLLSVQEARSLVARAHAAWQQYALFTQSQVDRIVAAMARVGAAAAEELARLAVTETGFGSYQDKVFKNRFASAHVGRALESVRTVGVIRHDRERGVMEIAEPMGVLVGLIPVTSPTAAVLFKSLVALKARNTIVFSPHPRAPRSAAMAASLMNKAAVAAGAPSGVVQCVQHVSLAGTRELMEHRDVALILASGGAAMVRAAYGAGKPAIAVGPGNVPVYVDRSAEDIPGMARQVVFSKTFDNGTPCAAEQALVVDTSVAGTCRHALEREGAHFLSAEEVQAMRRTVVLPGGGPNPDIVGQPAQRLAAMAGFQVPDRARVLVAELSVVGPEEPLSGEILTTLLSYYTVAGWEEGLRVCNQILAHGGLGHTVGVYAGCNQVVAAFAGRARAFRVLVNCPTAVGSIGYLTGLEPSLMIGTGTWGGGISSDNITARHLVNVKRLAYRRRGEAPADGRSGG